MRIALLDTKVHDRSRFVCEEPALTEYLKKQAGQDMKKRLTACFVLLEGNGNIVKGYYTLSGESVGREDIPAEYRKKVPRNYRVPVTLLGRLARDITMRGRGAGELLLMDALWRSYRISRSEVGSMAVVVDPLNEQAVAFYLKYGFILLPVSGRMFLPMHVIRKVFG